MKGSKGTLVLEAAAASPPLAGEDIPQGVSAPISKRPVKKTRAGKRTFVPPHFQVRHHLLLHVSPRVSHREASFILRRE